MWFPDIDQVIVEKNPSYLKSVFIGFTAPILHFPGILWQCLLQPLLDGLLLMLCALFLTPIRGLFGNINGRPLTKDDYFHEPVDTLKADDKDKTD